MLDGWHEFYGLLGTGAAALVALLFVAASIGASVMTHTPESANNTRTFMSPVVFHYTNILFLSLIALVPTLSFEIFATVVGIAAIGSVIYSMAVVIRVHKNPLADTADRFAYGAIPAVCYAAGLVAAVFLFERSVIGLDILAGAALLLLVVNIRNAWDLMISLARSANRPPPSQS
ncbi:MAG TPA: hypothetical protein VE396_00595 [Xanthobacteraceae bacterium]|jgi:hypothetical protein|nr:hypothetical protein [Xanthobacteraceae bacterium]